MNGQLGHSKLVKAERAVIKSGALLLVRFQVSSWELVITVLTYHSIGAPFNLVLVKVVWLWEWISAKLTYLGWLPAIALVLVNL